MSAAVIPRSAPSVPTLPLLDRLAVAYLVLPLTLFLVGWLQLWAALPLLACVLYGARLLLAPRARGPDAHPVSRLHLTAAIVGGCAWTYLGGTAHFVFANADWFVRDAVLHDLVASPWPVGYGALDGFASLLRAPLAYYLPAALVGKLGGLMAAHYALAAWTAAGVSLFLMLVLSLVPSRTGPALVILGVVILFSGLDFVGNLINTGPRFLLYWHLEKHLEWWAGTYQYSSMTTQLFWVPNHALGGWLAIGLLCRERSGVALEATLPLVVVAATLWSPLTALGLLPFVIWRGVAALYRERSLALLHPLIWGPALLVGIVVAAYLTLDTGAIPKGITLDGAHEEVISGLLRQTQFFLLEAGFIGMAVWSLRRSGQVALALAILAVLPLIHFGPYNDLVMRASIPSLTVLAIAAGLALLAGGDDPEAWKKKAILSGVLLLGALTPVSELARALRLPVWPVNTAASVVGVNCGGYPAHYIARLHGGFVVRLLRQPYLLALEPIVRSRCVNPAVMLMFKRGLLDL